jgi:hypothetical protein
MNKHSLHHTWRKLHPVSYWYFLAACIICAVIGIFAMRQNNLNAIKMREKVSKVDEQNGDVEAAMRELREYVYAHMNTNLSSGTSIQQPVQLKYRYERLVAAEKARVADANTKIYTEAQAHCERLYPASASGGPRVPCIESYVTTNGVKEQQIPDALYKFSFASPRWSADLAGISLLLSGIFFILFVLKFMVDRLMHSLFKHHL